MQENRKEVFKGLFQKHYPCLCHIAYGYVLDRDESEDIVQELFINVWDKGKDTLPEKEFAAYMTTAIKNSCISFLRKKQGNFVSIDDYPTTAIDQPDEIYDEVDEAKSPENLLQVALASLPPKCKEVFLMAKLKGMKYREIAEKLNLSEKTIENQMTRAIRLLRTYVAEYNSLRITIITIVLSILLNYK
ncbi:MAG TPA: RNA polymerase sigma-70 factor [Candidatus Barnesiella merdipullorum]|nr:RNA polymerase sigma-70 factor [Candidatus Barnesiella merdipullorum]